MEEQRKERTIDELAAENDALRKKADELNKEIEYLQQQVNFLSQLIRERKSAAVLRYWGICLSKKLFMRLRTRPVTDAAAK